MTHKIILVMFIVSFLAVYAPAAQEEDIEFLSDSINTADGISQGKKTVIAGFYFDPGSSSINPSLQDYLKKFADGIKKIKYNAIIVEAYTDNSGAAETNKQLSRTRAKAISEELKKNGIPGKKITYFGRGQINPVADNNNKNGRIQNRRTEITVK